MADPECRERAGVAHSVLFNIDKEAKAIMNDPDNQATEHRARGRRRGPQGKHP